jgi:hypothetical protein
MIFPPDAMYSDRDYLAPTVFKKNGIGITSGWNYYGTINEAIVKWKFLNKIAGGADITPEGQVVFQPNTSAQTMGINVDFYALASDGKFYLASYKYLRGLVSLPVIVFRFYTTLGNGPYYAIYDPNTFGMAATAIDSVSSDKLAALDDFYREVQVLKYRYNSLAGFLNDLGRRTLSSQEQQIFNEGVLKLQSLQGQITTIKGIEITYTASGAIIGLPILLIIAIIAILAAATAWTITSIINMKERTKQINDAYQLNEWVADKKTQIAQLVTSGEITPGEASDINKSLDTATAQANKVADNASKTGESLLGNITSIIKWAAIGFVGVEALKTVRTFKTSKA